MVHKFEWIVKNKDFKYWYDHGKVACGAASEQAMKASQAAMDASQDCCNGGLRRSHSPSRSTTSEVDMAGNITTQSSFENKETNSMFLPMGADEIHKDLNQISVEEQLILNRLRSNPTLVERFGSFASAPLEFLKKKDEQSVGGSTHPDSEDGFDRQQEQERLAALSKEKLEEEEREKKKRENKFLIGMIIAFILALIALGLTVAMLVPSNNSQIDMQDTMNDEEEVFLATAAPTVPVTEKVTEAATNATLTPTPTPTLDYRADTDYLVGAYYYPWYNDNFHRGEDYLRRRLVPRQEPMLGEYNSSDVELVREHMAMFRRANIGLIVTSWWGPYTNEDNNTKNVIMEHEDVGNLQIALHYETEGRIKDVTDMSVPLNDIQHMCENYFDHPNYYQIDGRPVLVVYVTRSLYQEGVLEETLLTMRSEASKCGHNLYIIGDQVFQAAPDQELETFAPFTYFDAVTNYDVYGSKGQPEYYAGRSVVDNYYRQQREWRDEAAKVNCEYIPPVSPGYNDRSVRIDQDHPPLSRKLNPNAAEGSLFWHQLKRALPLVSERADKMILVNSFNEWHEDTQIEPVRSVGQQFMTNRPPLLTGGVRYEAYENLYLDLLGAATARITDEAELFENFYENGGPL